MGALDVSDDLAPQSFDRNEWVEQFQRLKYTGQVPPECASLKDEICRTIGKAPNGHGGASDIPVVWKTLGDLAHFAAPNSKPGRVQGWRETLENAGLLFHISDGKMGRGKIIILKFPGQTEADALIQARTAIEAYNSRPDRHAPANVEKAIDAALADREAVATADAASLVDPPGHSTGSPPDESENPETEIRNPQKRDYPPLYKEFTKYSSDSSSETPNYHEQATPSPPPSGTSNQKSEQIEEDEPTDTQTPNVLDATEEVLKETIQELFELHTKRLAEGPAIRLAKLYGGKRKISPRILRRGLDGKLGRLFTPDPDKEKRAFSVGQVVAFLINDVEDDVEKWNESATNRQRPDNESTTNRQRIDNESTTNQRRTDDEPTERRARNEDTQAPTTMVLDDIDDVWAAALDELAQQVSPETFDGWLDKITPAGRHNDGTFVFLVSAPFYAEWINDNYRDLIEDAIADADGHETVDVDFAITHEVDVQRPIN